MTPGALLAGKYRLVSPLGEGGMGVVWRAEDVRLAGASVAVKLLHPREAANPELRARFEAEARTAARLRGSPHIVQVLDVGVDGDNDAPFIAMELLEGETLRDRLLRTGTLSPAELGRIAWDVARGLTRAHELGVIHRDLKPSNIFLVRNLDAELAKVLDFGIAKRLAGSWHHAPTATGALLGTPIYMSPEQIVSSRDVDLRADLWSLAVIAVECLTGKLPFESDNLPGLALLICQGHATLPSRLGAVPPGFDSWFQRATHLAPEQRFRSAVEMGEELRKLCSGVLAPALAVQHATEPAREAVAMASSGEDLASQLEPRNASSLSLSSTITRHLTPRLLSRSRRARWAAAAGLTLIAGYTGVWLLRSVVAPTVFQGALVAGQSPLDPSLAAAPPAAPAPPPPDPAKNEQGAASSTAVPVESSPSVRVLKDSPAAPASGAAGSSAALETPADPAEPAARKLPQPRKAPQRRKAPRTEPQPKAPEAPATAPAGVSTRESQPPAGLAP